MVDRGEVFTAARDAAHAGRKGLQAVRRRSALAGRRSRLPSRRHSRRVPLLRLGRVLAAVRRATDARGRRADAEARHRGGDDPASGTRREAARPARPARLVRSASSEGRTDVAEPERDGEAKERVRAFHLDALEGHQVTGGAIAPRCHRAGGEEARPGNGCFDLGARIAVRVGERRHGPAENGLELLPRAGHLLFELG